MLHNSELVIFTLRHTHVTVEMPPQQLPTNRH
jgi:hypothetical protein